MKLRTASSDVLDLLRDAGDYAVPAGAQERVANNLRASLAGAELAASSGGVVPPPEAGRLPELARRFLGWSLPSLCVGALLGATGSRVFVSAPAPVAAPATIVVSEAPSAAPSAQPAAQPAAVAQKRPAASTALSTAARSDALAQERAILDRARSRLSASELAAAMKLLDQHAQRFPRGVLSEEREAMAVNVLVRLGQIAEGRKRGEAFRNRFPTSLMLPSVDAALAANSSD